MVDSFVKIKLYDQKALRVKGLIPTKTPWGREDGRPIYDRLPSGAETYQIQSPDNVLVYLEGNPQSLAVGAWQESPSVLVIQSGKLTWEHGQVPIEAYAVNVKALGLQDGDFQVGYYLDYVQEEFLPEQVIEEDNISLSRSLCLFESSKPGINQLFQNFLSGVRWETSSDREEWFAIDFSRPVLPRSFNFSANIDPIKLTSYSLYSSNDAIVWEFESSGNILQGQTSVFVNRNLAKQYWKFYFSGGIAGFLSMGYSGQAVYPDTRPSGKISRATPFIDNKFAELEQIGIVLGYITIKNGEIIQTVDARRTTEISYEPVAKWLTTFQDERLKSLFEDVSNYSKRFLSPTEGLYALYNELNQDPNISIGDYKDKVKFLFPSRIDLDPPRTLITNAELLSSDYKDLVTDREELQLEGENVPIPVTNAAVIPFRIVNLGLPEFQFDAVNKTYLEKELNIPVDNGTYN